MAGKICPNCDEATFFQNSEGRACTKCGFKMILEIPKGKRTKCSNCGKFQVFNNKCKSCGAKYSL